MAPNGQRTQSEGEILDLLLATHFPNSVGMEGGTLPAAVGRTNRADWRVAAKIVTYRRVEWANNSFGPYKRPGADGIFPAAMLDPDYDGQGIHTGD